MALNVERLQRAKEDLAALVEALETGNFNDVSQEGHGLVSELSILNDFEWDSLISSMDDDQLRERLGSIRQKMSDERQKRSAHWPIRSVGHRVSFSLDERSAKVWLRLVKMLGESIEAQQDLEDTLWIGAAIVEAVSQTMKVLDDTLSPEAKRNCIGTNFKDHLERTEEASAEIRRLLESMLGPDEP